MGIEYGNPRLGENNRKKALVETAVSIWRRYLALWRAISLPQLYSSPDQNHVQKSV